MYTKINGANIYYEIYGKGNPETFFFIHGAPGLGDCRNDIKAFSSLSDKYQLVFLDMRGSGRSEDVPPYTHEQWTSDIDELRKQIGSDKINILGGSYGGFLTLEYVLRYPDHVSHVVLRDTAANNNHQGNSIQTAVEAGLSGVNRKMLERLFDGRTRSNQELKETFAAIQPLYTVEYDPEATKEKIENIFYHYETHNYAFKVNQPNYDVLEQLGGVSTPTLVTVGRHDWITPVVCSEEIASQLPNAELVIYENSGHSPHLEQNTEYLKKLRSFLGE